MIEEENMEEVAMNEAGDGSEAAAHLSLSALDKERLLPIANVARLMKRALPENAKIAKDAKDCVQECVSEFISFVTSEASDRCAMEKRKTVNGEDILWAMQQLGFDNYNDCLKIYLQKYRESTKSERGSAMLAMREDNIALKDKEILMQIRSLVKWTKGTQTIYTAQVNLGTALQKHFDLVDQESQARDQGPSWLFGYSRPLNSGDKPWTVAAQTAVRRAQRLAALLSASSTTSNSNSSTSASNSNSYRASTSNSHSTTGNNSTVTLPLTVAVKRLDALSDELCAVLDATELVLNVHPDPSAVRDAANANALLTNFMNELNTDRGLFTSLDAAIGSVAWMPQQTPSVQTTAVAQLLMKDFRKSGIHLSGSDRKRFVSVSDHILSLGNKFVRASSQPSCETIEIENAQASLTGVDPRLVYQLTRSSPNNDNNIAVIHMDHPNATLSANLILKTARNENVRRFVYRALNSASEESVATLEELLKKRAELANLLGSSSYSEMWLGDKMATSPENVMFFLASLSSENKPLAQAEISRLATLKKLHTQNNKATINAWDEMFFAQFLSSPQQQQPKQNQSHPASSLPQTIDTSLRPFFSVGTTIAGISELLTNLYGIRLEPASVRLGETWHPDVRKVQIVHETEGVIGIVYMDLFARESSSGSSNTSSGDIVEKFDGAAQFTVRCSRRLEDYEEYCGEAREGGLSSKETEVWRRESSPGNESGGGLYQLPIVVLVTQFERPISKFTPSLLSLTEVETLFHEIGHVMHSVVARTDYQHISGTRCALDFVEVPSNFLESFARDESVLVAIGTHYKTGAKVPVEMIRAVRARQGLLEAVEKQKQLKMAVLDQMYHSEYMKEINFNSTEMLQKIQNDVHVVPYVEGTQWQTQFSHLFSYGASYYSYFWARRVSDALRSRIFATGSNTAPLTTAVGLSKASLARDQLRKGGEVVKSELLQWGGGRDPWIGLKKAGIDIEDLNSFRGG
ncbi:Mitochondrial intermediate peptidase [Physocladia obscura]|uniref:mitochondrial intermediate peptidase n=1 Tax=Physocladia obscura TaxID=109957 RepID=A0AAD5X806_9FUNG|nr:Mitochondrial intermediate peptidase [Physocladia obscura]